VKGRKPTRAALYRAALVRISELSMRLSTTYVQDIAVCALRGVKGIDAMAIRSSKVRK
jgi:hypothetical protein